MKLRKYRDAYVAVEEDDLDLTYFILHSLSCIRKAREVLQKHLEDEKRDNDALYSRIAELSDLTRRQKCILLYMASHADEVFGISEVSKRFDVTYQTARTDLMQMEARGYLCVEKGGRSFSYTVCEEWKRNL